ncbi:hypothetical protein MASR2M66_00470 [Chloroflexota bacterium]
MEILGIGLPELIFIFVIALLILGPKDMQKSARTVGLWLNKFVRSNVYLALKNSSAEIKNMSTNLMREANMELKKTDAEIRKEMSLDPRLSKFVIKTGGDNPSQADSSKAQPEESQPAETGTESEPQNNA